MHLQLQNIILHFCLTPCFIVCVYFTLVTGSSTAVIVGASVAVVVVAVVVVAVLLTISVSVIIYNFRVKSKRGKGDPCFSTFILENVIFLFFARVVSFLLHVQYNLIQSKMCP